MRGKTMKKTNGKSKVSRDADMLPEYDLKNMKGAIRGKYYDPNRTGHKVTIHNEDGTVVQKYFSVKDGAIMLAPDVRRYFPDSRAVNNALRCLIPLVAQKKKLKSA
jgi:hypothetical protein